MIKYINVTPKEKDKRYSPIIFDRSYRVLQDTFIIGYVYRGKTTFTRRIGYRNFRFIFWFAENPFGKIAVGKSRKQAIANLLSQTCYTKLY